MFIMIYHRARELCARKRHLQNRATVNLIRATVWRADGGPIRWAYLISQT